MKKARTYESERDWLMWTVMGFTGLCCSIPLFMGLWIPGLLMMGLFVAVVLLAFTGIYYEISGDDLIVHSFRSTAIYPILEIREIAPTKSWLASPAPSLSHRIAIRFNRRLHGSAMPLIISPARREEFLADLLRVNPDIIIKE